MTGTTSHCNTLQHTAYCNTLKRTKRRVGVTGTISHCYTLKHICNTLQHAATRQPTSPEESQVQCLPATHRNILQHMQHTATRCNTPTDKSRGVTGAMPPCNTPEHTAAHATHCKHTRTNYSTCNTLHQTKRRVGVTGIMSQKLNL